MGNREKRAKIQNIAACQHAQLTNINPTPNSQLPIPLPALLTFFIFLFSLFSCSNPLVIQILGPKTVSFETNGGGRIDNQTVYRGYPIKRPPNPSKSGHTFDAWYIDNETFEEQWDFAAIPAADITLYAKWISGGGTEPGGDTFTVTFDANGGMPEPVQQTIDDGGKVTEPTAMTKTGYTFGGWFREPSFTTQWNFASDTVSADITLYAKWSESEHSDEYIVTFVYNDGVTENRTQNVFDGDKIDEPSITPRDYTATEEGLYLNPVPDEYKFDGWFKELALTNEWDFFTDTVDGDITLYAKWIEPKPIAVGGGNNWLMNIINYINAHGAEGSYTLLMNSTDKLAPGSDPMPQINTANFDLTIKGISDSKIGFTSAANRSLFTINNPSATLTLGENITLQGMLGGTNSLVTITNGTLVMESGSTITGHTGRGVHVNGGTFNMNGGTISNTGTNSNVSNIGNGVYVSSGMFTMSGGTISKNGNSGSSGGGVAVSNSGIFIMNDGDISENSAPSGGGVHVSEGGMFTMNGGKIRKHGADNGGGVAVGNSGTFNMTDGIISENSANNGAGVNVSSGGIFNMNGGAISGNNARTSGGGVYVGSTGSFKISNGIVYGNDYNDLLNNTAAGAGAALYVEAQGIAQWFSNSSWSDIIGGSNINPKYSNDTINYIH